MVLVSFWRKSSILKKIYEFSLYLNLCDDDHLNKEKTWNRGFQISGWTYDVGAIISPLLVASNYKKEINLAEN